MGLGAVVLAGLAAWLLGLVGGRPLGEGSGLALAGAGRLVQLAAEALDLGLQVTQAPLKGLASGTRDGLHTPIIGEAPAATALPQPQSQDQLELVSLSESLVELPLHEVIHPLCGPVGVLLTGHARSGSRIAVGQ